MARRNQSQSDTEALTLAILAGAGIAIVTTSGTARAFCDKSTGEAVAASSLFGFAGLIGGSIAALVAISAVSKD